MKICYTGPFLDSSGYGEATRNFIKALHEAGADFKTELVKFTTREFGDSITRNLAKELAERNISYDVKILHVTPDLYKKYMEPGKYNIGHLFWETTRLPEDWVRACNSLDEIWTGAGTNAQVLKDSGVTVPITIIPEPINIQPETPEPFQLPNFNGFVFYSIFEWTERKNPRTLLNAFWREFKGQEDVCLLIKTHKGSFTSQGVTEIITDVRTWKRALGHRDSPRVFLCTDMLSDHDKHKLHETGDAFVSAHRGEGWGIPAVEACLHKKPVIAVKYGGVYDYFSSKHMYIVEHEMVKVDKIYNKYYGPSMEWADASEKSLREKMRKMYDLTQSKKTERLIKATAYPARNLVMASFNYKTVGEQMLGRLEEIE